MKIRDRFIAAVLGQTVDHPLLFPGKARMATIQQWEKQGLAPGADWVKQLAEETGIPREALATELRAQANIRMNPCFEEKVLERKERSQIVQDWKGNICEISNDFDVTYLRSNVAFVTRRWLKCPVETRDDWRAMQKRYLRDDPVRFPDAKAIGEWEALQKEDQTVVFAFNGLFMELREWMGFEGLCTAFYDDPDMVDDMLHFYGDYVAAMLTRWLPKMKPTYIHIGEDMAYKRAPMVNPQIILKKFSPIWRRWAEIIYGAGIKSFFIDCDGYIFDLVPAFIAGGANGADPLEIAAGNDLGKLQEAYGRDMAFMGGVDKRAIAASGDTLLAEMERITPFVEAGKYIPSCDHGIPNDVTWPAMVKYTIELAKVLGLDFICRGDL